MKIVIPGGTGQLGMLLSRAFLAEGHAVVVLSRHPEQAAQPAGTPEHPARERPPAASWRAVGWDAGDGATSAWAAEIDGADAVINLAGRSVDCRYTAANRRAIMDSRVQSTRAVGRAVAQAEAPPRVWLQASTATIYAHRYDAPNDEHTGRLGGREPGAPDTWRFSIDVAKAWEAAADAYDTPQTRVVKLRSAMVMSPDRGGVFGVLLTLVRLGLGGRAGDGRQFVSWIHDEDFVRAVHFLLGEGAPGGPVNLSAPRPLPNAAFMRALREAWGMPFGLPAAEWMLEIGAFFLRTETELVLKSRRVVPTRLQEHGFAFRHPAWPEAARDLCRRWRWR